MQNKCFLKRKRHECREKSKFVNKSRQILVICVYNGSRCECDCNAPNPMSLTAGVRQSGYRRKEEVNYPLESIVEVTKIILPGLWRACKNFNIYRFL